MPCLSRLLKDICPSLCLNPCFICFPGDMMKIYSHTVESYFFCPAEFPVDCHGVECLRLPHFELIYCSAWNKIRSSKPGQVFAHSWAFSILQTEVPSVSVFSFGLLLVLQEKMSKTASINNVINPVVFNFISIDLSGSFLVLIM